MTEHNLPKNIAPRAIFGDFVEPAWDQRLTITVGSKEADLVGASDRVIQAAVDYVARRRGGTVRVLPGTYRLRNSIFLQSNTRSWRICIIQNWISLEMKARSTPRKLPEEFFEEFERVPIAYWSSRR